MLCSSTGIIGRQLPMEKVQAGVQAIELSADEGNAFAEAIMTTDTRPKRIALEFETRWTYSAPGRCDEGRGHDLPQYGNHALLPDDRCRHRTRVDASGSEAPPSPIHSI